MNRLRRAWRDMVREVVWSLDICDGEGDPSLAKAIALAFGVVVVVDMVKNKIGAANSVAAGLVISAAMGRSAWMKWLDRNTFTTGANITHDSAAVIDALKRASLPNMRADNESGQ